MSLFHWTDGNIHTTALTPRDYQTELLATAREENLIVCIAHNSAKEFLAVKLIQSMRTNRWSSHPEAPGKAIYLTRMDRSLLSSMVSNLTDLQVANVDDVEDSEGSHEPDGASNTPVTDVASADVLFFGSETTLLQYIEQGTVRVQDISLLIVDECHKNYGRQELWEICARLTHQAPSSDRPAQRTRILGLAGPLHGAGCTPERLCWELHYLERCLRARIETASDITSVLRFSTKPTELILECIPPKPSNLTQLLRMLIQRQIAFLKQHRYEPLAVYGLDGNDSASDKPDTDGEPEKDEENDDLRRELKSIPDPTVGPLSYLKQYLELLDEFGPWGADRGALELLTTIDQEKVKVPYDRHFLLFCMVYTTLLQARATVASVFAQHDTELERIKRYSTPKVRRLLEVLAWFGEQRNRPKDRNQPATLHHHQQVHNQQRILYCFCRNVECKELEKSYHTFGAQIADVDERIKQLDGLLASVRKRTERLNLKHKVVDNAAAEGGGTLGVQSPRHGHESRANNFRRKRFAGGGHSHHRSNDTTDALCGLIFCNNRAMARILYVLLYEVSRSQREFEFISPQYTVDKVATNPQNCLKQTTIEHRKQEEVLKRFRMHECNLLIGTSVLEEGIELPKCNLVIRWNSPANYRSYAQCKGRAKAPGAYHVLFVTPENAASRNEQQEDMASIEDVSLDGMIPEGPKDDNTRETIDDQDRRMIETATDAMIEQVAIYREVEKLLLAKCRNGEPPDWELKHADCFNHCLEVYRPSSGGAVALQSNGTCASLWLGNAIQTLNKYCAKLPSDTFTKLTPIWRCATTVRKGRKLYQYTIRLPINSPWKEDILGLPMPTETLARRLAAYMTCRMLHAAGELDNSFQPFGKEAFRAFEADWENFELEESDAKILSENSDPRPGTTKRRQYYYKRIASVFNECRPDAETVAYLYHIRMELICPIPEEQNTRGRKIYAPEESAQGFGILTTKLIPKISSFPIFTRSGEVKVSLDLCPQRVKLSAHQLEMVNCFVKYTFTKVLRLQKSLMLYDANATENCFFIVPTVKQAVAGAAGKDEPPLQSDDVMVDWEFVEKIATNVHRSGPTFIPDEARKGYTFDVGKFRDAVVMPWYRNRDQPQYFYVAEICNHLSPKSTFPGSNYATFEEYYHRKYKIHIQNQRQPLLDVDHTSARLNFLTPRYVNRKGVALPTSSEETKRAKRENLEQKQILVPELCTIHPFPASLWRAAVCLPCVLYRINALLLADEIRRQVARDLRLGWENVDELQEGQFQWPMLSFGWNLADVLRKTKEQKIAQAQEAIDASAPEVEDEVELDKEAPNVRDAAEVDEEDGLKMENGVIAEVEKSQVDGEDDTGDKKTDSDGTLLEIGTWSNEMAVGVGTDNDMGEEGRRGASSPSFLRYDSDCSSNSSANFYSSDEYDEEDDYYLYDGSEKPKNAIEPSQEAVSGTDNANDSGDKPGSRNRTITQSQDTVVNLGGRLKIEFKSETDAEAIDSECDLQRQRTQQSIIERSRQNDMLYQSSKNAVDGFCYSPSDRQCAEEREQAEQRFERQKNHTKDTIRQQGSLVRWNEPLSVSHWRSKLDESEAATLGALMDDLGGQPFTELVPYVEPEQLFELLVRNGSSGERWLRLHDLYCLNRPFFPERYTIFRGGSQFDNFLDESCQEGEGASSPPKVIELTICDPFPAIAAGQMACNYKPKQHSMRSDEANKNGHDSAGVLSTTDEAGGVDYFSFDYQPDLSQHPGPSPAIILQALTMSNANDGINLERLETIGDSFLKYAITTYLYCRYDNVHEGKLSHLRSKQVSNLNLYRLGRRKRLGDCMIAAKFEPHDNWLPPCYYVPKELEQTLIDAKIPACHWNLADLPDIKRLSCAEICQLVKERARAKRREDVDRFDLQHADSNGGEDGNEDDDDDDDDDEDDTTTGEGNEHEADNGSCYIPYNLVTQHSIPDKSVADCVEALIGAYLIECGPRGALLFMAWLGIRVLPIREPPVKLNSNNETALTPYKATGQNDGPLSTGVTIAEYGHWVAPPSPMVRANITFGGIETGAAATSRELARLLQGFEEFEQALGYRFRDRSYLLQAMTHASYSPNRLTDCYQRLEFLGDAILDYLITRHLYEDRRQHSPGALTDLRSALVNNTIFASLAVRHGFHKYFLHLSPGLQEVIDRFVRIQQENGHRITEEEYYLPDEDDELGEYGAMGEDGPGEGRGVGEAEDVEVPKALGDVFESIAGAIFLDSDMSLDTVWKVYRKMMGPEIEKFSSSVPKSPIRELLEMEPETAKFGKPEKLTDGRRVRVTVEVFGKGTFRGIGRNYRIAKCTAAKCALRQLKKLGYANHHKRR
ncbi:AGAP002836-PB [Anopheles gambiae str. PEST]|uniref:ribonuclease III n=1 Tax=Anopheles gambiae TaxID=7165 RepID=F5HKK5_ANOGA|nr:endoribonuclease Dcr-1 [Anopheles gambiae]EGK96757.1 AGAP002836-PB [Anopheles gambiae str. PEST]